MLVAQCPDHESLHAFSTGRLSSEQTDEIAAHVQSCSDCLAELTTLSDDGDSLVVELRAPVDDDFLQEPAFRVAVAEARTLLRRVRETGEYASSPAPRVLAEYELLEELGRGGMGRVYKARHTKLDRIVALKILPSGRLENAQSIARFEREMRAIGRLDHPHIVHAYDGREIEQMPVLVMEYVDGVDLAEVVRRLGRLKPADACELVRQAALGLQYAHGKGMVHRDIKPSNLMLTRDGILKVLDLGLARFYVDPTGEEVTGAGQTMGTADYIAPEQVGDSRSADTRSDIYSLGCTLYKLLAGKTPYAGRRGGAVDKMNAHVREPLPPIEDSVAGLSPQLLAVLQRMTAKRPEERFATPDQVAEALEPLCDGADTIGIFQEAEQVSPPAENAVVDGDAVGRRKPASAAQSQRRKAWHWLVALGLVPCILGIGFAAGVTLMIYKDGQETKIELPDGVHARISAAGDVAVTLPKGATVDTPPPFSPAAAEDLTKMQGLWKVAAVRQRSASPSWAKEDTRFEFRGDLLTIRNEYSAYGGTAVSEAQYEVRLEPERDPEGIYLDYVPWRASAFGDDLQGTYRFRDDRLELSLSLTKWPADYSRQNAVEIVLQRPQESERTGLDAARSQREERPADGGYGGGQNSGLWHQYGVTSEPVAPLTAKVLEWLGLHFKPISKDQFRDKNVFTQYSGGLELTYGRPGGPAEKAGFFGSEIIVGLHGKTVTDPRDLDQAMHEAIGQIIRGDADALRFQVLRSGESLQLDVPGSQQLAEAVRSEWEPPSADASAKEAPRLDSEAETSDYARLQGAWEVEAVQSYREPEAVAERLRGQILVFGGGRYTAGKNDLVMEEGTYILDPNTDPKSIDLLRNGATPVPGIYRQVDGRMWIAMQPDTKERPKDFRPGPDAPNRVLMILRRTDASISTGSREATGGGQSSDEPAATEPEDRSTGRQSEQSEASDQGQGERESGKPSESHKKPDDKKRDGVSTAETSDMSRGHQRPDSPNAPGQVGQTPSSGVPLAEAIRAFQERIADHDWLRHQPPLTEEEVVAAIRWYESGREEFQRVDEHTSCAGGEYRQFLKIAETGRLPEGAEISALSKWASQGEKKEPDAWSLRIQIPCANNRVASHFFPIRDRWMVATKTENRGIAWGEPAANGLQAGVVLEPRKAPHRAGYPITPRFFLRNTTDQPMQIDLGELLMNPDHHPFDKEGIPIEPGVARLDYTPVGPVGRKELPLAAGESLEFWGTGIVLGRRNVSSGDAKPGEKIPSQESWRMHFALPNYETGSRGVLRTGEISFVLIYGRKGEA